VSSTCISFHHNASHTNLFLRRLPGELSLPRSIKKLTNFGSLTKPRSPELWLIQNELFWKTIYFGEKKGQNSAQVWKALDFDCDYLQIKCRYGQKVLLTTMPRKFDWCVRNARLPLLWEKFQTLNSLVVCTVWRSANGGLHAGLYLEFLFFFTSRSTFSENILRIGYGSPENAGLENGGPKKSRGWKMQDWKMTDESARLENAGLENDLF